MRKFKTIQVQTITICNRDCEWCPYSNKPRQEYKMTEDVYQNIVNELADMKFTGRFSPYLMNEPTLDDRLLKLVDYAINNLRADIMINTNGTGKNAEWMIPDLIKKIEVRINCYDDKTWKKWKDYEEAADMRTPPEGYYNRAGQVDIKGKPQRMCKRVFEQMYIDYLGRALLCCSDYDRSVIMGDTYTTKLLDIFNNTRYGKYRKFHKAGKRDKLELCKNCNYPTV